ncbi:MAG: molybdate ABC transporter substrate-binding protein [Treponema sp.]|jgi:molybdate transport system substrate-binding protein|nr:molybdate ABC transporter substrate-binding protein [Treponema sp.]
MKSMKTNRGRLMFGVLLLLTLTQTPVFAGSRKEKSAAPEEAPPQGPVTLLVAAAASLENTYVQELIPLFQKQYPRITVQGIYDSSGRLQTQIEQGLEADVFMSAATRQMDALVDKNFIAAASVKPLLQNKLVLIKPVGTATAVTGFQNITEARIIALGDPATTPAGQYAQEAFTNLGIWEAVSAKVSLGSNVTEVLNWVGEGSAEVGIVYATDAASTPKVAIIEELPEGLLATKVIYPVGMLRASQHPEEAQLFINFLASSEALGVFQTFGFSPNPDQ